jgi:hypothetical protein
MFHGGNGFGTRKQPLIRRVPLFHVVPRFGDTPYRGRIKLVKLDGLV